MKHKSLIFLLSLTFYALRSYGNCELSWVSDWELGQNWLHTEAVYPKNIKIPPVIQVEIKEEVLDIRCNGIAKVNCPKFTEIKYENETCKIKPKDTNIIPGKETEMGGVFNAHLHIKPCLKINKNINIGLIEGSTLVLPKVSVFKKEKLDKKIAHNFSSTDELKSISVGGTSPIHLTSKVPEVKEKYSNQNSKRSIFIVEYNVLPETRFTLYS